jgi:hypothetical protein
VSIHRGVWDPAKLRCSDGVEMDYRISRAALDATEGINPTFAVLRAVLERAWPAWISMVLDDDRSDLTSGQRFVAAIMELESMVNNDGFDEYFACPCGDTVLEALEGLRTIGATRIADVLARAIALFPNGRPARDTETRGWELHRILTEHDSDPFDLLNKDFYDSYEGDESLGKAIVAYIRANPKEFFVD